MTQQRILVAGIGNIFLGDDGFGGEVAQQLLARDMPEGVSVYDFGIRSFDLAFAMLDEYDATILIDATQRGGTPGTLYLIEPDVDAVDAFEEQMVDAHSMNPVAALQLVKSYGGRPKRLFLVGCEPAVLSSEDGHIGLSAPVRAAVDDAIDMIESLIARIGDERGTR